MNAMMAESDRFIRQIKNQQQYGRSGGAENRGILTDIKAADLPDETPSDFSNAPYDFEEAVLLVKEDMQRLDYHAGTANRFSADYLKYMTMLEKFVRQAGTYCLTKTILEQKGFDFPKLQDLTIEDLVQRVSFHLRKCHAAIDGLYRDNDKLGFVYLQWELRRKRPRLNQNRLQKRGSKRKRSHGSRENLPKRKPGNA